MRLVIISDTHCNQIPVPDGDVLIHCGDHTHRGDRMESLAAMQWLDSLPHRHKLFIAGNHELEWQDPFMLELALKEAPSCTYLYNSGLEINGIKFWGSPVQPEFCGWAFQLPRGKPLKEHWKNIPKNTDVLITHGPPFGFGDRNDYDLRFGDQDLLDAVLSIKPKIHCYGHAHAGYGEYFFKGIHFINAAILNEQYRVANKPIIVDIE